MAHSMSKTCVEVSECHCLILVWHKHDVIFRVSCYISFMSIVESYQHQLVLRLHITFLESSSPYFSLQFLSRIAFFFLFLVQSLELLDVLAEIEKRGITFDELLTIPEQDDWVYSDGKSTTCVAFILAMYKEAGIFGPISNSIQVTEFTVSIKHLVHI